MNRLYITKQILARLERALEHANAASDPKSPMCAVAPEHREAMRIYLRTWVVADLQAAVDAIKGADRE